VQQYRKDHKGLPNWLSDLSPDYISDPDLFLCPVQRRTGSGSVFSSLADPKIKSSYTYEFSVRAIPSDVWGGDKAITMQTWKSLEMAVLGGKVPLLRCLNHGRALNLSFDGAIWESDLTWEADFADVIDRSQLNPRALVERFSSGHGSTPELPATSPSVLPEQSSDAGKQGMGTIPGRDPKTSPDQIDLSRFYNVSLQDSWHSDTPGNNLAELPTGVQVLDGTAFDVRGAIQISSTGFKAYNRTYPHEVSGIPIKLKASRVHFLHGCGWSDEDGSTVGRYIIHYADGQKRTLPIVYGRTVRDWWFYPDSPKEASQSHIAWTGSNQAAKDWNPPVTLRLYKTTWRNPQPDVEISSIDFVSAERSSAPFLVAITAE
jgi:hypothetical protein